MNRTSALAVLLTIFLVPSSSPVRRIGVRAAFLFDDPPTSEYNGTTWQADLEPPLRKGETKERRRAIDEVLALHWGEVGAAGAAHRQNGNCSGGGYSEYTYGEITPRGVRRLVRAMGLQGTDKGTAVFYDLGSGAGAVVAQIFLEGVADKSLGVELSTARHEIALKSWAALQMSPLLIEREESTSIAERVWFINGDVSEVDFSDATHIYACSLCFPLPVVEAIARRIVEFSRNGRLKAIAALSDLQILEMGDEGERWEKSFENVGMTWGRVQMRIYTFITQT